MKKITVDKSEGIAEVIDRIIAASDADITLVIPKNSALAKSPSNFRLLKREADLAEKNLEIDSESEDVLELAEKHDIAIAGSKRKDEPEGPTGVSDIIAKKDEDDDRSPAPRRGKKFSTVKLTVRSSDEEEEEEEGEDDDEEEEEKPKTQHKVTAFASARAEEEKETSDSAKDRFFQPRQVPPSRRYDDEEEDNNQGGGGRKFLWFLGILVVLGVIFYASTILFGRAQVSINFTQTPWNYQASFIADQAASTTTSPGPAGGVTIIPGQVFTSQKNITQIFLATGPSTTGSSKSQGTITIYNDYGSAPQELVATTRFVTPDGKIFRLVNDTTVPGATVGAGGAITPSSVDAAIIADQGGSAYNVGPVSKLTIPGFQTNSAKRDSTARSRGRRRAEEAARIRFLRRPILRRPRHRRPRFSSRISRAVWLKPILITSKSWTGRRASRSRS